MNTENICSKERPYSGALHKEVTGRWIHKDAVIVGEEYNGLSGGGDYETYKCPHCGVRFRVELPD